MEFLPDGGHDSGPRIMRHHEEESAPEPLTGLQGESGTRWIKGDCTLAQLSEPFDVHANQITDCKDQLVEFAAEAFERGSSGKPSAPAGDVKTLHAKIGELTLENDFLEAALGKAGLPSAKR